MKILVINLSPSKEGTSNMLTKLFAQKLSQKNEVEIGSLYQKLSAMEELLSQIKEADSLVMIGPCYVNSYPAETIQLLQQMAQTPGVLHGQKLYGFIQGGMPYIHTHESGLRMLENFAQKENVCWQGGFVMGGGAALAGQPLEKVIGANKMVPAVHQFIDAIGDGLKTTPELYQNAATKLPAFMSYILCAMMGHMIRKKYRKLGLDYKKSSPYL